MNKKNVSETKVLTRVLMVELYNNYSPNDLNLSRESYLSLIDTLEGVEKSLEKIEFGGSTNE